jgi:hypothetical protein
MSNGLPQTQWPLARAWQAKRAISSYEKQEQFG